MNVIFSLATVSIILFAPSLVTAQKGAYQVGYNEAAKLWNPEKYGCNSFFDVTGDFWNDVQKKVVFNKDHCKKYESLWEDQYEACEQGAKDFTLTQASECMALSDCSILGDYAGSGVSALMCPASEKIGKSKTYFFPPICVEFAKIQCQQFAILEIDASAKKGQCGEKNDALDLSSKDLKKIGQLCGEEVEVLAKTADPL